MMIELAFLEAVPSIYHNCEKAGYVYHRPWLVLERFYEFRYDGVQKHSLGFEVSE